MAYQIEVFKHTVSEWYPNFDNDLVRVALLPDNDGKGNHWRISIRGADDCGREKLYPTDAEAVIEFMAIIGMKSVDRADIDVMGFKTA